jgi:murein DD-endopeptidase MepM/ murein hydrolase activator NlpD
MGDLLAGNGDSKVPAPSGKRVARHAAEQALATPYSGRRVARPAPEPVPEPQPPAVAEPAPYVGRRIAPTPVLQLVEATTPEPPMPIQEPVAVPVPVPALVVEPTLAVPSRTAGKRVAPKTPSPVGRRVAPRRTLVTRLPGVPLIAGLAILAVSAGGALQAMNPATAGAADSHRLVAASALSGSSGIASASLLGGRGAVVSRSGDRASSDSLQAEADAQAKQRDEALSAFAAQAEKQAAKIKLHQWVLPVAAGVYHLTARFGDYSSLWSHFHTGLDFAAPTGTPIMAVAGGTISETGYSGAYGNRTIETLPDGTELWYCHQNEFGTSVGATVKPGQVIGYVGSTGNVTGPHLHLEVHPGGGDPVDPYAALVVHGLQP